MGCCVSSSHKTSTSSLAKFHDPPKPLTKPSESNSTVEETVKEVLLETPTTFAKSKPQKPHQNTNFHKFMEEKSKVEKRALTLSIYKAEDTTTSEEVCSLSRTVSRATSITDQRDEMRKRVYRSHPKLQKNRSFPGERRERTVVHGARNNNNVGSVRLVQCRDQTSQKIGNGGTGRRRDPAENSLRRSRSQATVAGAGASRPVMGRSPYVRKPNRSTASIGIGTAENGGRKTEKPATTEKWPYAGESLENPLVSLECFIFI
ncbi:hypothetical protein JHK85_037405 [Glycine max]|nr:hypothetical protein JHK85_037405 [Glycine max]